LLPPAAAAAAGFTACGSLALSVTTSNSVGTELICLNSRDLQQAGATWDDGSRQSTPWLRSKFMQLTAAGWWRQTTQFCIQYSCKQGTAAGGYSA
jgi:hypothetical protein